MAFSSSDRHRCALIPTYLYSPTSFTTSTNTAPSTSSYEHMSTPRRSNNNFVTFQSPSEPYLFNNKADHYTAYALAGLCGNGRVQFIATFRKLAIYQWKYNLPWYPTIGQNVGALLMDRRYNGFYRGWASGIIGAHVHGAFRFGFYEFFKKYYSDLVGGPENDSFKYRTMINLASAASAEAIAAVALCPFEAIKAQTEKRPVFTNGFLHGLRKLEGGVLGLRKGLIPLWCRQVPYTMLEFGAYETSVELMFKRLVALGWDDGLNARVLVPAGCGFTAGALCGFVSNSITNIVSYTKWKGGSFGVTSVGEAVKQLGFRGLCIGRYHGFLICGLHTTMRWVCYETYRLRFGLPTTACVVTDRLHRDNVLKKG